MVSAAAAQTLEQTSVADRLRPRTYRRPAEDRRFRERRVGSFLFVITQRAAGRFRACYTIIKHVFPGHALALQSRAWLAACRCQGQIVTGNCDRNVSTSSRSSARGQQSLRHTPKQPTPGFASGGWKRKEGGKLSIFQTKTPAKRFRQQRDFFTFAFRGFQMRAGLSGDTTGQPDVAGVSLHRPSSCRPVLLTERKDPGRGPTGH